MNDTFKAMIMVITILLQADIFISDMVKNDRERAHPACLQDIVCTVAF